MRNFLLSIIVLGFALAPSASNAEEKNKWIPLFGENLSEAVYSPDAWMLESGGILTATKDDAIWTKVEYENFELDLDFRTDHGTNSGVIVYCTDITNWIPNSVEVQIADDYYEKWKDARGYEMCGAIYGHLEPRQKMVVKESGEWNHMRVRCAGQRISVILNGKRVIDMNMALWTSGTENPDGSEIPDWLPTPFAELPTKGFIGLQGKHGDATVWFRNVKIRSTSKYGFSGPEEIEFNDPEVEENSGTEAL